MLHFFIPPCTDPDQYMMAVNDLLPDDDAMMNLAIQLSLQQGEVRDVYQRCDLCCHVTDCYLVTDYCHVTISSGFIQSKLNF